MESFALHTRALADFCFKEKTKYNKRTDARAWDYIRPRDRWTKLAGEVPLWLGQVQNPGDHYRDSFGTALAHLSFGEDAVAARARGWPVMQVSTELGRVLGAFAENVDPSKVTPDFKSTVRRELPLVAVLGPGRHALGLGTPPLRTRPLAYD